MSRVNVLIGSAGRRNYLVRWFKEAQARTGALGSIYVVDSNPAAPSFEESDDFAVLPLLSSPHYGDQLREKCAEWGIDLALSLNDYEISAWAANYGPVFEELGITLVAPSRASQRLVEDKYAYQANFASAGLLTPRTTLATDIVNGTDVTHDHTGRRLIKHRFGSGSGGLTRCDSSDLKDWLRLLAPLARDRCGRQVRTAREGYDCLIVQPELTGQEYNLDLVADLQGRFQQVLARRKLAMRAGETDAAVTESPDSFLVLAERISAVTQHPGSIDVDLIMTPGGELWLIDINPRFGGGYPFSHLAGADLPACYLNWYLGRPLEAAWLRPKSGVTSSKCIDVRTSTGR